MPILPTNDPHKMESGMAYNGGSNGVSHDHMKGWEELIEGEEQVKAGMPNICEEEAAGEEDDEAAIEIENVAKAACNGDEPDVLSVRCVLVLVTSTPEEHEQGRIDVDEEAEDHEGIRSHIIFESSKASVEVEADAVTSRWSSHLVCLVGGGK